MPFTHSGMLASSVLRSCLAKRLEKNQKVAELFEPREGVTLNEVQQECLVSKYGCKSSGLPFEASRSLQGHQAEALQQAK